MTGARQYSRLAPWWSPWGFAVRLGHTVRSASDIAWLVRVGWFVLRLPSDVERMHLEGFLSHLEKAARPRAADPQAGAERVARLRQPWLRVPGLRSRDTCYVRALTLYRFLDPAGHDVQLRVGVEWFDKVGGVLRGHAWVTLDGAVLEGPPEADAHGRLQLVELRARTG
ncbi:MAG TPA: lasso peptide biosynthesis B2 protein [Candidatus Limnocylindria bacterium]|nr:lasso peptide biosynthesis B2 protein [Candidatus Limnocylindria bacterium]